MQTEIIEDIVLKNSTGLSALKKVIVFLRKNSIRLPEVIMEAGLKLLKNHKGKLGDEYYIVLEQIFYSALELEQHDIAHLALSRLREKFSDTAKTKKMNGIYHEAMGDVEEAERIYDHLLAENALNQDARKRKIALLRANGEYAKAVDELNAYLEDNMLDKEAWLELGDIYLEKLQYQKALFCYEQLCILAPKNMNYFLRCADISYTLGGLQYLTNARSYYSFILNFESDNVSALFGLLKACKAYEAIKKNDAKNKELMTFAAKALKAVYERKNPGLIANFPLEKYTGSSK